MINYKIDFRNKEDLLYMIKLSIKFINNSKYKQYPKNINNYMQNNYLYNKNFVMKPIYEFYLNDREHKKHISALGLNSHRLDTYFTLISQASDVLQSFDANKIYNNLIAYFNYNTSLIKNGSASLHGKYNEMEYVNNNVMKQKKNFIHKLFK